MRSIWWWSFRLINSSALFFSWLSGSLSKKTFTMSFRVGPVAFFTDAFFSNCVFLSKSVFENATEIKRFRKKRYWIKTHLEKTQLKENATEFIPKAFFVKYYRLFRFKSVFFSIAFFYQMRFLLRLRFMCTSMFNELNQKRLFSKTFSISKTFSDSKISTFFYYTRSNVQSCAA